MSMLNIPFVPFPSLHSSQCLTIQIHNDDPKVANWCHQFALTEEGKGRDGIIVDNKMLTSLQKEEVQLLVSLPTTALGNRVRENVWSFEALASRIQLTQMCEKAYFQYRVTPGKQYKTRPDRDDGWRTIALLCPRILKFSIFSENPCRGRYSCTQNTSLDACTTHFLVACRVTQLFHLFTHAYSAWLKHKCVRCKKSTSFSNRPPSRPLMSMLNVPFVNFPSILSSLTASSSRPSPSISIRARSRCQSPSGPARWSGLGRKADPAPDTGYEPKLADFFSYTVRRSTFPTTITTSCAQTISPWFRGSCAQTIWPWFPQVQKVCRARQHQQTPQPAEFHQFSVFPSLRKLWQVMCRVVLPLWNKMQFLTKNLLQQRFLVHRRKGKEIDTQTLCSRWKTENKSNRSLNGKLARPLE